MVIYLDLVNHGIRNCALVGDEAASVTAAMGGIRFHVASRIPHRIREVVEVSTVHVDWMVLKGSSSVVTGVLIERVVRPVHPP